MYYYISAHLHHTDTDSRYVHTLDLHMYTFYVCTIRVMQEEDLRSGGGRGVPFATEYVVVVDTVFKQ